MILDEYTFEHHGTPPVINPLLFPEDHCSHAGPRLAENCGSIEQLADHRSNHQRRINQTRMVKGWKKQGKKDAEKAKTEHGRRISPRKEFRNALPLQMSTGGATPGEWRLVKMYGEMYGKFPIRSLREVCAGIKGAETEFPGIGRKSLEDLREHMYSQVCALYLKHNVRHPVRREARRGREDCERMRCRNCKAVDAPLLECIGCSPCDRCAEMGLRCVPGRKLLLPISDRLRVQVLDDEAYEYL